MSISVFFFQSKERKKMFSKNKLKITLIPGYGVYFT